MKKNRKEEKLPQKTALELKFEDLDATFTNPINRILQIIFLPVFFFGLLGFIWMIPFPQFEFLVKLNWHTFLNWASFFIAVIIYCYLKLSPTLSYAILFCVGILSYFIVQIELWGKAQHVSALLIFLITTVCSCAVLWLGTTLETKKVTFTQFVKFMTIGPIWLWHFAFKKLNIRY